MMAVKNTNPTTAPTGPHLKIDDVQAVKPKQSAKHKGQPGQSAAYDYSQARNKGNG